eukprot:450562_1
MHHCKNMAFTLNLTNKRLQIHKKRCTMLVIQSRNNTSPFPLRPGYGLGSMLPPTLIDGMKKEAIIRSKILVLSQMESDIESTERELLMQMNQITNSLDSSQTLPKVSGLDKGIAKLQNIRQQCIDDKIAAYEELADLQLNEILATRNYNAKTAFTTFDSSIESPIDWGNSVIDYIERAADSMQVNAEFFNINKGYRRNTLIKSFFIEINKIF